MIVEQRTYTLKPGGPQEWFKLYEEMAIDTQKEILGNMVGYFYTEFGPLNQIVHMWGYDSLNDRAERRAKLFQDPRWQEFIPHIRPLMVDQASKVLIPAPFSPIR